MLDKVLPTVIALGYFDSVHLGHQRVIKKAREFADKSGCSLTVFTFFGNVKDVLNGRKESSVYLPGEREKIIKTYGADNVYFAPTTEDFLSLDKKVFLALEVKVEKDWRKKEQLLKNFGYVAQE